MRILVVHNSYQQIGGEDSVVRNEMAMLSARGNDVHGYLVTNARIEGFLGSLRAALGAIFSIVSYREVRKQLANCRPEVVHVHNFFPLISPSVFYACHKEGIPTVFTLHNFRIICPSALLMHEGVVTERSLHEGPWWAVFKRVYRGSLVGTFVLATMISVHRYAGTWSQRVTRFIALTRFAAGKFTDAGIPASLIHVKPNFVNVAAAAPQGRAGMLFVGRLSHEKGVEVLVAAVRLMGSGALRVKVAGVGPLAEVLKDVPGMTELGGLDEISVYLEMASARALVMPSLWYEGFPMVLAEAYACGLPVIASRIGALAELVEDRVTGLLFDPGSAEDLADKMAWALDHPKEMERMGSAARERYEMLYTEEINYVKLMAIYRDTISANDRRNNRG